MARNAIVVSVEAHLSDDEIAEFKESVRENLQVPDDQEVYVISSPVPIRISSVVIQEDRE